MWCWTNAHWVAFFYSPSADSDSVRRFLGDDHARTVQCDGTSVTTFLERAGGDMQSLAIAAYLGVREVRVLPDRTNAGVAEVAVIRRDPLSGGKPLPWPWLDKAMTSLWDPIPVGVGEDGDG